MTLPPDTALVLVLVYFAIAASLLLVTMRGAPK